LEVGFLIDKLLIEPLQKIRNDIFIVVDGLDEADMDAMDTTSCPEIEVFISRLARLSTARILFIM